jgi:hypothetical protein
MLHDLEVKQEPGLVRSRVRETVAVVRRPEHGEARVALECGHCHREGIFVIQDLETTKQLRRGPAIRSLIVSFVLIAAVIGCAVVGFAGDSILFQVLTLPAALLLLPAGIFLAVSPSGNLGVATPESVVFDSRTKREGFNLVTRGARPKEGVTCIGFAAPTT